MKELIDAEEVELEHLYSFFEELSNEFNIFSCTDAIERFEKDSDKAVVEKAALELPNVTKHLEGMNIVKVIVIPNRIVNIVVKPQ